jgi:hypothetical protein
MKIDKLILAKAIGIMCLSWTALPVVYYLLVKRENDEDKDEKDEKDEKENTD